ncbi:hypothetical protein [Streptomyces sp. NPDC048269]|uniref:hypothetical protein n=1 Tax=Streptomyces sp. NPDC048269 TaxID=3155753 RepID=UPI00343D6FFA
MVQRPGVPSAPQLALETDLGSRDMSPGPSVLHGVPADRLPRGYEPALMRKQDCP